MKNNPVISIVLLAAFCAAGCQSYYQKVGHREHPGQPAASGGEAQKPPDANPPVPPPPVPPPAPEAKPAPGKLAPDAAGVQ